MNAPKLDADQLARLHDENLIVEDAIREAVREATVMHKHRGQPMVVWRDGQVVWIPEDQLTIDDEHDNRGVR